MFVSLMCIFLWILTIWYVLGFYLIKQIYSVRCTYDHLNIYFLGTLAELDAIVDNKSGKWKTTLLGHYYQVPVFNQQ